MELETMKKEQILEIETPLEENRKKFSGAMLKEGVEMGKVSPASQNM